MSLARRPNNTEKSVSGLLNCQVQSQYDDMQASYRKQSGCAWSFSGMVLMSHPKVG